jgi:hypothetical protein
MTAHHIDGHRRRSHTDDRNRGPAGRAKEATGMSEVPTDQANRVTGPGQYEIRVRGHLAARWTAWFDGMTLTARDDGTTAIQGTVTDQSALHGLLRKLSDIGLPLVSVTSTAVDEPTTTRTSPQRSTT